MLAQLTTMFRACGPGRSMSSSSLPVHHAATGARYLSIHPICSHALRRLSLLTALSSRCLPDFIFRRAIYHVFTSLWRLACGCAVPTSWCAFGPSQYALLILPAPWLKLHRSCTHPSLPTHALTRRKALTLSPVLAGIHKSTPSCLFLATNHQYPAHRCSDRLAVRRGGT